MLRLVQTASTFIDFAHPLSQGTLGESFEHLLAGIDPKAEPDQCPIDDAMTSNNVQAHSRRLFFYRPHRFGNMSEELELAHRLQRTLLPQGVPTGIPCKLTAVLESYCHLSGDVFGWSKSGENEFRVWVLDMCGHGIRAGIMAAVVKLLMDDIDARQTVASMFTELNSRLRTCLTTTDDVLYATGVFLHIASDSFSYTSAAHPALLHRSDKGNVRVLPSSGLPLGVFKDSRYELLDHPLRNGDALLFCTDGVLEAGNSREDEFGLQRLISAFASAGTGSLSAAHAVFAAVARHQDMNAIDDDITFVITEHTA